MDASSTPDAPDADHEATLLDGLRRGNQAAHEAFVRQHIGRMRQVARRILGTDHDADDAVQDAFLSAFNAIGRFDGKSKLSTWLHRIVVNAALMKLRTRRRRPEVSIEALVPRFDGTGHRVDPQPAWVPPDEDRLQRQETRDQLMRALDELPGDFRTVLVLRDIESLNTQQTATMLELSEAAVKTRLHRARQALRTLLEREFA